MTFRYHHIIDAVATAFILGFGISMLGERLESRLLPVFTDFKITKLEPVGDTHVRLWGTFFRYRDCYFLYSTWNLGNGSDGSNVKITYEEGTRDRGLGPTEFGPWLLDVNSLQLLQTDGTAYHQCHPFWKVRTDFFDGEELELAPYVQLEHAAPILLFDEK